MAWTAPKTWVANAILTAAELNVHIRDNLQETAPAKATEAGQIFVSTAANTIAARKPASDKVPSEESTNSETYGNIFTVGPRVTVATGSSALVFLAANMFGTNAGAYVYASVAVSGATSIPASDSWSIRHVPYTSNARVRSSSTTHMTGLTPGNNTFTMQYRVEGSTTGFWRIRELVVVPL